MWEKESYNVNYTDALSVWSVSSGQHVKHSDKTDFTKVMLHEKYKHMEI